MTRRFQFSLRALLMAMLVVAAFFGGVHFERERRRQADEREPIAPLSSDVGIGFTQYIEEKAGAQE